MNQKERMKRKRWLFGILETGSALRTDSVRFHSDGYKHFMVKSGIGYILRQENHEFMTEAEFPNGCLADVLDLRTGTVYEVETNASKSDVKSKTRNFPYDPVRDVIVLDPVRFSENLEKLRGELRSELVL